MEKRCIDNKVLLISYKQLGGSIEFGWSVSPFGDCLVLLKSNVIVGLSFKDDRPKRLIETEMKTPWRELNANFNPINSDKIVDDIFNNGPINISFTGTKLQEKVWKTLLEIPIGETTSYTNIAKKVGNDSAVRSVATAIGKNPIAWLIPCHRVIRKSGDLGGYRWGLKLKKLIISSEKTTQSVHYFQNTYGKPSK